MTDDLTRAIDDLKKEIRRSMKIYVALWIVHGVVLYTILAKIAGLW